MVTLYSLLWQLLNFYVYIIIAHIIFKWLCFFQIINPYNRFVSTIGDILYRFSEPSLSFVRRFLPNLGGLDLSPVIVIFLIYLIQGLMQEYLFPIVLH